MSVNHKKLGPGLLFAGAAIGVSHLVQTTSAGANYGYGLTWAILLALILKYPFFEFGTRYAAATGETLLSGYKKLGNWAIGMVIFITLGTMFTIQAAVTVVTAGIAESIFDFRLGAVNWSLLILTVCLLILTLGRYSLLDKFIKYIIILLSVATLATLFIALQEPAIAPVELPRLFGWDRAGIVFLIALMGWMPAPLDLSIWSSIWTVEKKKIPGNAISAKDSMFDFKVGYIGTSLLALCFLSLGATVLYGTGTVMPSQGTAFAGKLISIYTQSLGEWSYYLIVIAAFTTMFSTTLTCLDAFPRVLGKSLLLFAKTSADNKSWLGLPSQKLENTSYWIWIILIAAGALVQIAFLGGQMGQMVQIATVLSFLSAPVFAGINYLLVTSKHMPDSARPRIWLKLWSWAGLLFLCVFSVVFLVFWLR